MQFSIATVVAFAGLVTAQIDGIPQCAVTCLTNAAAAAKCTAGDLSCLCSPANYQTVVAAGGPCIVSSCGADVATNQVLPAAGRLCAAVVGGGGPASTVAAVVSSARASISSVAAAVSSRVASASSARASASASAVRASVSAAISSAVSQATAAITSAVVPATRTVAVTNVVTSRNGTATATSTVTPVSVNGASVQGPVGVLAVLVVAAFAAL